MKAENSRGMNAFALSILPTLKNVETKDNSCPIRCIRLRENI